MMKKIITGSIILVLFTTLTIFFHLENEKLEKRVARLEVELDAVKTGFAGIAAEIEERLAGLEAVIRDMDQSRLAQAARYRKDIQSLKEDLARAETRIEEAQREKEALEEEPEEEIFVYTQEEAAEEVVQESLRLDDVELNAWYRDGLAAFQRGDYTRAREEFSKFLDIKPPVWEATLYYIESSYHENPSRAAGDKQIASLLAALPESLDAKGRVSAMKGLIALEQGDYKSGLSLIEHSLTLDPSGTSLANRIGMAAYAFRDYKTCIAFLSGRSALPPEAVYILGRAYETIPDTDAAMEQYLLCIGHDPVYFPAYSRIGIMKMEEGDYAEAAAAFLHYHAYKKEAETMYLLGECYLSLNNEEKARSLFKEIVSRFPDSPQAEEVLRRLEEERNAL